MSITPRIEFMVGDEDEDEDDNYMDFDEIPIQRYKSDFDDNYGDQLEDMNDKLVQELSNKKTMCTNSKYHEPSVINLKHIHELPPQFRNVFSDLKSFNNVQSIIFDDVYRNDNNLVVCAPTASGKTVLFELAIMRLLVSHDYKSDGLFAHKIVYMAPLKALITEKLAEWRAKFDKLHRLKCIELTGDTVGDDEHDLALSHIILTTPEKWDFVTRKYNKSSVDALIRSVKLFMIDEIHVMGENSRGATIEAVISRMKFFNIKYPLRFIAVSATIPNIGDFAEWLRENDGITNAIVYDLDEKFRPVKVEKFVIGFRCPPAMSDYVFDLSLNYKLADVIEQYAQSKPTLVFCSSRKGTVQAATILVESASYIKDEAHKKTLKEMATKIKDTQLRDLIVNYGVGCHHAGLDKSDRSLIESLFLSSNLLVLFSTSTLSMGINLPAHLVIIKSTKCYSENQSYEYYSITQMQQMIGRAGRPQFDKTAKAVILTKESDRANYASFIEGKCFIESQLHKSLIEYMNAEIVLKTIVSLSSALDWLKSTYLWIRVRKNPSFYGVNSMNDKEINNYLMKLCEKNLNELLSYKLIERAGSSLDLNARLSTTSTGKLMAYYYVTFETMKSLIKLHNEANNASLEGKSLADLVMLIASCKELDDIKLRTSERAILNDLNNNGKMPKQKSAQAALNNNTNLIRYRFEGKVRTSQLKINVLIQAELGTLGIKDFALHNDTMRIFHVGHRVSKCLLDYLELKYGAEKECSSNYFRPDLSLFRNYRTFESATLLFKCFSTQLWHDSPHLFKQFAKIGDALSRTLVDNNVITFEKMMQMDPVRVESLLRKRSPFGTNLINAVRKLPRFDIELNEARVNYVDESQKKIDIICKLLNIHVLSETKKPIDPNSSLMFILGDNRNNLIYFERIKMFKFQSTNGLWRKQFTFDKKYGDLTIFASLILLDFVGLDVSKSMAVFESEEAKAAKKAASTEIAVQNKSSMKSDCKLKPKKSKINLGKLSNDVIFLADYENNYGEDEEDAVNYAWPNDESSLSFDKEEEPKRFDSTLLMTNHRSRKSLMDDKWPASALVAKPSNDESRSSREKLLLRDQLNDRSFDNIRLNNRAHINEEKESDSDSDLMLLQQLDEGTTFIKPKSLASKPARYDPFNNERMSTTRIYDGVSYDDDDDAQISDFIRRSNDPNLGKPVKEASKTLKFTQFNENTARIKNNLFNDNDYADQAEYARYVRQCAQTTSKPVREVSKPVPSFNDEKRSSKKSVEIYMDDGDDDDYYPKPMPIRVDPIKSKPIPQQQQHQMQHQRQHEQSVLIQSQSDSDETNPKLLDNLKRAFSRNQGPNKRSNSVTAVKSDHDDENSLTREKISSMFDKFKKTPASIAAPDPSQPKITDTFCVKKQIQLLKSQNESIVSRLNKENESAYAMLKQTQPDPKPAEKEIQSLKSQNESTFSRSNKENESTDAMPKQTQPDPKPAEKEIQPWKNADSRKNFEIKATLDDLFGKDQNEPVKIENKPRESVVVITDDYLKQKMKNWSKNLNI